MSQLLTLHWLSKGAKFMILSAFAFSVMALFVKLVGERGIPVLEIVAARSVISLVMSYVMLKKEGVPIFGQQKGLLFARGFIGFVTLNCVFYGVTHLPLAEATVLQYLHPMFTAILALVFLKERLTPGTLVCIGLSFMGLIIMVQPIYMSPSEGTAVDNLAVTAAIIGAMGSAMAYVLVRKLGAIEHPLVIVLYFPLISLPASTLLLWDDFIMPEGLSWLYLLVIGIATQIGQVALTKSMQTETASRATSFSYLQIVFAVILGLVFFQDVPNLATIFGALFIVAGAYINVAWKSKPARVS